MLSNSARIPQDANDSLLMSVQVLRICLFVALPVAYSLMRQNCRAAGRDAEEQPLLEEGVVPGMSHLNNDRNLHIDGYGATKAISSSISVAPVNEDEGEAQQQQAEEEEEESHYDQAERFAREKKVKRLEIDGNWWAYLRSFKVCATPSSFLKLFELIPSLDFHSIYRAIPKWTDAIENIGGSDVPPC